MRSLVTSVSSSAARWLIALSALASLGLAGCGGGGGEETAAKPVRVEGNEYSYVMPDHVKGGVVDMNFVNTGVQPHEFALARLDPGKTLADLEKTLASGQEPLSWAHDIGGVPVLTPGDEVSITRRLRPGTYTFLCFIPAPNGKPHYALGMKKQFTVSGDSGRSLPKASGAIVARDTRFDLPVVHSGRQTLELRNAASAPREFNLATLNPGNTIGDAGQWFRSGFKGTAPLHLLGAMQSIPPGTSVFATVDFEAGRTYFVSDEENHLRAKFSPR